MASAIRFGEGATVKWISPTAIALNILGVIALKFNAAVPPPQRGGLGVHPPCSMIRERFQYVSILYNKLKMAAKKALPAGEGGRSVEFRGE